MCPTPSHPLTIIHNHFSIVKSRKKWAKNRNGMRGSDHFFCFVAATAALEKTDFFDDNFLIPPSRSECESTPSDPPSPTIVCEWHSLKIRLCNITPDGEIAFRLF